MGAPGRALAGLVAGLAAGALIARAGGPGALRAVEWIEPLGTIWVNGVRMTIVPLVVSLLLATVAGGAAPRAIGRLGGAALLFFIVVLAATGLMTALAAPALLAPLEIDPAAAGRLRESAARATDTVAETVRALPTPMTWLVQLVPVNPVRAAVDGAMLPLILFTIALGAALSRASEAARAAVVAVARGVADAMLVIVGWLFVVAPVGVFALGLAVAARLGAVAVGAIGYYVVVFSALMVIVLVAMYPIAVLLGGIGLRRFAAAAAPAQAVAFASRSSSVALPAMLAAARDRLGLPAPATGFVLPFAVTLFRVSVPVSMPLGALFLGKLYGVEIGAGELAALTASSVLLSFSVPPIPSGSLFLIAPLLVSAGIPAEGVGILIAADAIPDLFKTTAIVTSHLASTVVVSRLAGSGVRQGESK